MFDIKLTTLFFMCCILSVYLSNGMMNSNKRSDGLLSDIVNLLVKEKFAREKMMGSLRERDRAIKKIFEAYNNFKSEYKTLLKTIQEGRNQTIGYTGGLPSNNPNFPSGSTIKFSRVISKFGKGYDTKSGVFTCVHPGTYSVDISLTPINCVAAHAYLVKNHSNIARLYTGYHIRNYPSGTMAVLVKLKNGDQIWIKSKSNCRWFTDSYLTILRV